MELRPLPLPTLHIDLPLMGGDEGVDVVKPQPFSPLETPEEGLEDEGKVLFRDSDPVVFHGDLEESIHEAGLHKEVLRRLWAEFEGLDGVDDDVDEDVFDLKPVERGIGQGRVQIAGHTDSRGVQLVLQEGENRLHLFVEVDRLQVPLSGGDVVKDGIHDLHRLLGVGVDLFGPLLLLTLKAHHHHLGVAHDRGHLIVDLMEDTAKDIGLVAMFLNLFQKFLALGLVNMGVEELLNDPRLLLPLLQILLEGFVVLQGVAGDLNRCLQVLEHLRGVENRPAQPDAQDSPNLVPAGDGKKDSHSRGGSFELNLTVLKGLFRQTVLLQRRLLLKETLLPKGVAVKVLIHAKEEEGPLRSQAVADIGEKAGDQFVRIPQPGEALGELQVLGDIALLRGDPILQGEDDLLVPLQRFTLLVESLLRGLGQLEHIQHLSLKAALVFDLPLQVLHKLLKEGAVVVDTDVKVVLNRFLQGALQLTLPLHLGDQEALGELVRQADHVGEVLLLLPTRYRGEGVDKLFGEVPLPGDPSSYLQIVGAVEGALLLPEFLVAHAHVLGVMVGIVDEQEDLTDPAQQPHDHEELLVSASEDLAESLGRDSRHQGHPDQVAEVLRRHPFPLDLPEDIVKRGLDGQSADRVDT